VQLLSLVMKKIVHEIDEAFQLPIYRTRKSKHSALQKKTQRNNMCRNNQTDPRRNGEGLFK
jgi:hypothetical protein